MTSDETHIRIPIILPAGEHCHACKSRLSAEVDSLPGVGSVEIDPSVAELIVTFDASVTDRGHIVDQVERLGHEVSAAIGHASWRIGGLDCPDCARTVDVSVSRLEGVFSASLNFASGVLQVEYDPGFSDRADGSDLREEIAALVERMDYTVELLEDSGGRPFAEFRLRGLDCPDCARSLAQRISSMPGVSEAKIDFATARLRVGYDPGSIAPDDLADAITATGYEVETLRGTRGETADHRDGGEHVAEQTARSGPLDGLTRHERATAIAGLLVISGWGIELLGNSVLDPGQRLIETLVVALFGASILVGGALVFKRARMSLSARVLDMNVLMAIAVIGAVLIGEWAEAAMVVLLFSIGGVLETRSLERTRSSIRDLMELAPDVARVVVDDTLEDRALVDLGPGDVIETRPGERIALDGRVVEGSSAIDESAITGESLPKDKAIGDIVYAGTLNTYGVLRVEVVAVAAQTTLSRVIYLVEEAQAQRAPFQRLVDRFTRWYTPAVTALAVGLAVLPPLAGVFLGDQLSADLSFTTWFYRALVLLVVSCPCALVISTPVAIVSAITRASRDGILIKGGAFLELAPDVRALAFDKTGTLTRGRPEVIEVVGASGHETDEVLRIAAALELHSTHPLAEAVVRAASSTADSPVAHDVRETPGGGVAGTVGERSVHVGSSQFLERAGISVSEVASGIERLESHGHTTLVVAADDSVIGVIGVADGLRPDAAAAVESLRSQGIDRIEMLTGDNGRVAAAIAEAAGLDGFEARMLPADKLGAVTALKEMHSTIAMVGDGVNDAPALAAADIGIAMGAAGSDTALETADVALLGDELSALPRFFSLGRRTRANIRQNVAFSVAIKLVVLVLAVAGFAPLWLAVFADTGVALLVILNGLRLLRPAD